MLYQLVIILCALKAPCEHPQWQHAYVPQGAYGCEAQLANVNRMFTPLEQHRFEAECVEVEEKDRPL